MVGVSQSLSLSDLFYMSLLHYVHRVRLKGMVEIKDAIKRNPYLLKYTSITFSCVCFQFYFSHDRQGHFPVILIVNQWDLMAKSCVTMYCTSRSTFGGNLKQYRNLNIRCHHYLHWCNFSSSWEIWNFFEWNWRWIWMMCVEIIIRWIKWNHLYVLIARNLLVTYRQCVDRCQR